MSYRLPAPPGALPVIRSGYRPDTYGFGRLFPPDFDLDLSLSDEAWRRITAGWPAAAASGGVIESPRSGAVMLLLAVLGLAAIGGAFWVARDG